MQFLLFSRYKFIHLMDKDTSLFFYYYYYYYYDIGEANSFFCIDNLLELVLKNRIIKIK
jgi:hypothetical protein